MKNKFAALHNRKKVDRKGICCSWGFFTTVRPPIILGEKVKRRGHCCSISKQATVVLECDFSDLYTELFSYKYTCAAFPWNQAHRKW